MRYHPNFGMAPVGLLMAFAGLMAIATPVRAQARTPTPWTVGAATGAYAPFSSLVRTADGSDTRLTAGPAFTLEVQYRAAGFLSAYAAGTASFGSIRLGSSIRPDVVGPTDQVVLGIATAGLVLVGSDWFEHLQPTLRIGGGLKGYRFDLAGAENQARPTGDVGVGLRGVGVGPLEVTAEARWLPSAFDQAKLPTRGIVTQEQRQDDVMLAVGIRIRP